MGNVIVDDDMQGYVYVFDYSPEYEHTHESSLQYKCHRNIKPITVVKVKFSDFKEYYAINEMKKILVLESKYSYAIVNEIIYNRIKSCFYVR